MNNDRGMMFPKIKNPRILIKIPGILLHKRFVDMGYIPDSKKNIANNTLFSASPMADTNTGDIPSLKKYFKEISDQYNIGSCSGNATADAMEAMIARRENKDPSKIKDLSRLFIYWNARNLQDPTKPVEDKGSRISLSFDSSQRYGVPTEEEYPYDTSKVNNKPSWLVYKAAIQNKIKNFYRLDGEGQERITQLKQALVNGNPIVFGTDVSKEFLGVRDNRVINPPTNNIVGGHAICCVGYDSARKAFEIRNSWGTTWGVQGYGYMSEEYMMNPMTRDLWVPTI